MEEKTLTITIEADKEEAVRYALSRVVGILTVTDKKK